MAGNLAVFTDKDWEENVAKSDVPVLVDFSAAWCGPCRVLLPTIEKIAAKYQGRVKVGKVDIEDSPETATRFNVMTIPRVLIFKGGQLQDTHVGVVSEQVLDKSLGKVLGG